MIKNHYQPSPSPLPIPGEGFTKIESVPAVPMLGIETLWFQVAGTVCNLACTHCFISCSPTNHAHEMLSLSQVREFLSEAERLAVKEFCFTGGEPFLNRDMVPILEETLKLGPALVLTNGMLIDSRLAPRLKSLSDASEYSLDFRVSLDSVEEEENDRIRGKGCFRMALRGVSALAQAGFVPSIATVRVWPERRNEELLTGFRKLLENLGVGRFRLKVFEPFKMGAEEGRLAGYTEAERVTWEMVQSFAPEKLQCSTCRMVTSKGVYVCPILINESAGRMGSSIEETLRPFPLYHGACYTCWKFGVSCKG